MWFVNHTNRQKVGFVWLPVLRYAVIFHTRLCTAVISRCFHPILNFFKFVVIQIPQLWIVNHAIRYNMRFVWFPILRYVEIFHNRLCTAIITPRTPCSWFSYSIEIVLTSVWNLYVYQFTYLPYYDIVWLPIFVLW